MYAPRGFMWTGELGDIDVIGVGDELHMFHLTLPNHDVVAHLVSSDGLTWKPLPPALRTGAAGDADDDMIWTMSVIEHAGKFYMLYTAICSRESGKVQRNALAVSDDLIHWEKHPDNPVIEADPQWYEAELASDAHMLSWRDPKMVKIGDAFYATIAGRVKEGPFLRRGSAALASSKDLVHWKVEPPLHAPRLFYDLECPQLFQIGRYFYLAASHMEDHSQRYWVAEDLRGPYRALGDNRLVPHGHYAGRVIEWKGEHLFFCWHDRPCDGRRRGREHLRTTLGVPTRYVPAPLKLVQDETDGRLTLESYSGWLDYAAGEAKPLSGAGAIALNGQPSAEITPGEFRLTVPGWMEILAAPDRFGDFILEGTVALDAASGGLAFALEDDATGYFVTLYPEEDRIELVKWLEGTREDGARWFDYETTQSAHAKLARLREGARVRLLVVGGEIEFSVDGRLYIAAISMARSSGRVGLFVNSGSGRLEDATVTPMRAPET